MSISMTWNGEDLSVYGLKITAKSIPVMPQSVNKTHAAIFGDSLRTSVNHTNRSISVTCAVVGASYTDLQDKMDAVLLRLNGLLGDKTMILDDEPDRRYIVRVQGISTPQFDGHWGKGFVVNMMAMAHKQATSEVNASIAIETSPDSLVTAVISGTASRIPVEIYLRNETGASLTAAAITVSNDTTSETITWTGTLEDDRWLRFGSLDSLGRFTSSIEKSNSTGADPEAETYTSVESGYTSGDWPRLKGGEVNTFTITGISTGTLETTYRARFF